MRKLLRKIKYNLIKRKYMSIDQTSYIDRSCRITSKDKLSIGYKSSIGSYATIMNLLAPVIIGNYVMVGPEVMFVTGNHRTDIIGEYMANVTNEMKRETDDQEIVIEDDCWIGARAIILKGVTIGKGSIIAAGAIVTKDVPPYTIYYGVNKMKPRFSEEQIAEHEKLIKEKYERSK